MTRKDPTRSRDRAGIAGHIASASESVAGEPAPDTPFLHLFHASPAGLSLSRISDGTIVEINSAFCRILGYRRDEMIGHRSADDLNLWVDPAARARLVAMSALKGPIGDVDVQMRRRDGRVCALLLSVERTTFRGEGCFLITALDVTESKRNEAALRLSEATYRALFSNMPNSVAHCRVLFDGDQACDFEFLEVNEEFGRLTNWTDVVGRRISDVVPDYRSRHAWSLAAFGRVASTGKPERLEKAIDGEARWVAHTIYSPARGEIVIVSEDITKRRLAEEEIAAAKVKFEAALNSMSDAVFISDIDGTFVDFNDAFATFHRFKTRDECAKTLREYPGIIQVRHADGTPAPLSEWAVSRALRGESATNQEYRLRRLDTGEEWVGSYSYAPIRDRHGVIVGSVVSGRDVTELRRTEDHLRTLSLAVEQSTACIVVSGIDGRIEYVNAMCANMSGYASHELVGQELAFLLSPRTPRRVAAKLRSALRAGDAWNGEFYGRVRRGGDYPLSARVSPILQPDGRVAHYVVVAQDITERRRSDAELRQHRLHLESLVEQRTRELAVARDAAEATTRAKSAFLAHMSHEVRTPLHAVLGVAQLAARDAPDDRMRTAFRRILDSGRTLLSVLNDILDLSKIDASKLELQRVPVLPGEVLAETVGTWSAAAEEKHLTLSTELSADLPAAFRSDPMRIGQILSNLVSNAIKFTTQGGVRVGASLDGEWIVFSVTDTGVGIREADIERLFDPFEQADTTTTRRYGGTGLGLSISRRLAELLGGRLSVASEVGTGTAFTLRMPLAHAEVPTPNGVGAARGIRSLAGVRVLAVDDNALSRAVLEEALVDVGAVVALAANGLEAVATVVREGASAFDIVLMDVQMPELDGLDATRQIHLLAPGLPVLGQTAHAHREERDRCLAAGMIDVVTKPIDFDRLPDIVWRYVRGSRA